nr:hypothetical protein [Dictyobacter alpinus]
MLDDQDFRAYQGGVDRAHVTASVVNVDGIDATSSTRHFLQGP